MPSSLHPTVSRPTTPAHVELAIGTDAPTERRVAVQALAVGENADMLAQLAAIVEHIGPYVRLLGENIHQRFADRGPRCRKRTRRNDITQMAGEIDFSHQLCSLKR
jgi:hypothetical protein